MLSDEYARRRSLIDHSRRAGSAQAVSRIVANLVLGGMIMAYFNMVATGQLKFIIWDQIIDYGAPSLLELDWLGNAHALRYSVVRFFVFEPALLLGVNLDTAFSVAVAGMVTLQGVILAQTWNMVANRNKWWGWGLVWFVGINETMSFSMNGRLAFAFLGLTVIIWSEVVWMRRRLGWLWLAICMLAGLFLTTVSSGIFVVAVSSIVLWGLLPVVFRRYSLSQPQKMLLSILGIGLVGLSLPIMILYVNKNLEFFGGGFDGFVNMLTHGIGVVFFTRDIVLLILILLLAMIIVLIFLLIAWRSVLLSPIQRPFWSLLVCAVFIGVFGYSTLLSGLPALMVLGTRLLERLLVRLGYVVEIA